MNEDSKIIVLDGSEGDIVSETIIPSIETVETVQTVVIDPEQYNALVSKVDGITEGFKLIAYIALLLIVLLIYFTRKGKRK